MPQPYNVQAGGQTTGAGVAGVDKAGNEFAAGSLTVGGPVVLVMQPAAPVQVPRALELYTLDGATLALRGFDGGGGSLAPASLTLPSQTPANPPAGSLTLYSPDGEALFTVDSAGRTDQVTVGAAYAPVVASAPATVSGVAVETLLCPGITVPSGGLAAGQVYEFEAWGVLTTTVDTQTVGFTLRLGGLTGTSLVANAAQNPNSSGPVTNQSWWVRARVLMESATSAAVYMYDHMSFLSFSLGSPTANVTVTNASSQQLVLTTTPSAAAVSVKANGFTCVRTM